MHTIKDNGNNLLRRIGGGDEQAFAELFSLAYDKIYSVSRMYLKEHEAAEDNTQQVFLKVWEKRNTLHHIEDSEAYLFTIAKNNILNLFRKEAVQEHYRRFIQELLPQVDDSPEMQLVIKQKASLLESIVRQLPARQQEAFRLSREMGLTYEEISRAMGISLPTVKEHVSKALAHIKALLVANRNEFIVLLLMMVHDK